MSHLLHLSWTTFFQPSEWSLVFPLIDSLLQLTVCDLSTPLQTTLRPSFSCFFHPKTNSFSMTDSILRSSKRVINKAVHEAKAVCRTVAEFSLLSLLFASFWEFFERSVSLDTPIALSVSLSGVLPLKPPTESSDSFQKDLDEAMKGYTKECAMFFSHTTLSLLCLLSPIEEAINTLRNWSKNDWILLPTIEILRLIVTFPLFSDLFLHFLT